MIQSRDQSGKAAPSLIGCDSMQSLMDEFTGQKKPAELEAQSKFFEEKKLKQKHTLLNNIENNTQKALRLIQDEYQDPQLAGDDDLCAIKSPQFQHEENKDREQIINRITNIEENSFKVAKQISYDFTCEFKNYSPRGFGRV